VTNIGPKSGERLESEGVAVYCSALQRAAVCCGVLQCVANIGEIIECGGVAVC